MIAVAREKIPHAEFVCQSFVDTICKGEFDGVVASYSLLCLEPRDFVAAARNITNVIKPGGYIFLALNEARGAKKAGFQHRACMRAPIQRLKFAVRSPASGFGSRTRNGMFQMWAMNGSLPSC